MADAFNKYVPSKLVAELIRLGGEPKIVGTRRELRPLSWGARKYRWR